MQYKIPQEMNVEDKIIGPFTLKGFGFVFAAAMVTVAFMAIFIKLGLSTMPSLIVGGFFGSFALIAGFVPYNGRPLYVFTLPFINFIFKPRQRVWKRVEETRKHQLAQNPNPVEEVVNITPKKQSLASAEKRIEEISLMVDTGGAYGTDTRKVGVNAPRDIFSTKEHDQQVINQTLKEAREKIEEKNPQAEPLIAEMATVDPKQKFEYDLPDTSGYKMPDVYYDKNIDEEGK